MKVYALGTDFADVWHGNSMVVFKTRAAAESMLLAALPFAKKVISDDEDCVKPEDFKIVEFELEGGGE